MFRASCSFQDNPEIILLKCSCLLLSHSVVNYAIMVGKIFLMCASSQRQGKVCAAANDIVKVAKEEPQLEANCFNQPLHNNLCSSIPGRVHSAMVSKLNPAQRSVTVEWYERGETKGKEVELDMLLALNPELIQNKQSYVAPPPAATAPVNLQRVSIYRQISRLIF